MLFGSSLLDLLRNQAPRSSLRPQCNCSGAKLGPKGRGQKAIRSSAGKIYTTLLVGEGPQRFLERPPQAPEKECHGRHAGAIQSEPNDARDRCGRISAQFVMSDRTCLSRQTMTEPAATYFAPREASRVETASLDNEDDAGWMVVFAAI